MRTPRTWADLAARSVEWRNGVNAELTKAIFASLVVGQVPRSKKIQADFGSEDGGGEKSIKTRSLLQTLLWGGKVADLPHPGLALQVWLFETCGIHVAECSQLFPKFQAGSPNISPSSRDLCRIASNQAPSEHLSEMQWQFTRRSFSYCSRGGPSDFERANWTRRSIRRPMRCVRYNYVQNVVAFAPDSFTSATTLSEYQLTCHIFVVFVRWTSSSKKGIVVDRSTT